MRENSEEYDSVSLSH